MKGDTAKIKKLLITPKLATFQHPQSLDSPLHVAIRSGSTKQKSIVELLVKRGADINAQNKEYVDTCIYCIL